jgi:Domain of unknown function (DUF5671)
MADSRLHDFIEAALRAGKSRDDIREALVAAGWSAEQIGDGLGFFSEVPFTVPVPRPRAYLSARDAFFYLLLFGTLYVSAYQFGSLLFNFINLAFPDQINGNFAVPAARRGIRWATASLIIAFPVFLWVSHRVGRELATDPARRHSAVRRWLTYLTLLVAASVIVGDSITLVYNLLSGEITVRFLLKVVVVAMITGTIFGYYWRSIRRDSEEPT